MQEAPRVSSWVVTAPEKALFDQIFEALDIDYDGFIVGTDLGVKEMFIKTGLSHTVLALIWNLCDIKQNGKLNSEQFALAMHFVNEVKKGHELPRTLTPEMMPPTLRPKPISGSDNIATSLANPAAISPLDSKAIEPTHFTNKELEELAAELRELQNEMNQLEQDVTQQETQLKLKESESKSLQNEYETLNQMLKQLENQKVEANRRLGEMDVQKEQLRVQMEQQKVKVEEEETRLSVKKHEFNALQSEEQQLESQLEAYRREIEQISKEIADSQLQLSQFKGKILSIEQYEQLLNDYNQDLDTALQSNETHKLNSLLNRHIEIPEELQGHLKQATVEHDPFADGADFPSLSNQFATDPFAGEDPFNEAFPPETDPFAKKDPFFESSGEDFFANDAFAAAFGKAAENPFPSSAADDPFAPKPTITSPSSDAIKSEDSTPELPPKNSKAPPPRPAPPKQSKPPARPAMPNSASGGGDPWSADGTPSPFESNTAGSGAGFDAFGNFADFAEFDKALIPPPVSPYSTLPRAQSVHYSTIGFKSNFQSNRGQTDLNNNRKTISSSASSSTSGWPSGRKFIAKSHASHSGLLRRLEEEERARRQKQVNEDYELAVRLSKQEALRYQRRAK